MNKRKGITLLALVITIVIMLLLAGVAIQMTMGENGLIAKSNQAKKEQAKAELLENTKLGYLNLKAKAIEKGEHNPEVELVLVTKEFTNNYNIVGDDITDKNGNIIETKQDILNTLKMLYPKTDGKKTVGDVEIPESDKDKMILKLKVFEKTTMIFMAVYNDGYVEKSERVTIDYGNGEKEEVTDYYSGYFKTYNVGEYIIKAENVTDFSIINGEREKYELEILHWGKIKEKEETNYINLQNISKIYEPEPDKIPIRYTEPKFHDIPEWLFSKKITSKRMSQIISSTGISQISENLFKNCINIESFSGVFDRCFNIKKIPENLFKYNGNIRNFWQTFLNCRNIAIIPNKIIEHVKKVKENGGSIYETFRGCERASNFSQLPEYMIR